MTLNRIAMIAAPIVLMTGACLVLTGADDRLAGLASEADVRTLRGRIGIALPYASAGAIGVVFLFAAKGAVAIQPAGWGVVAGTIGVIAIAVAREIGRLEAPRISDRMRRRAQYKARSVRAHIADQREKAQPQWLAVRGRAPCASWQGRAHISMVQNLRGADLKP